jgi:hypothetical protein
MAADLSFLGQLGGLQQLELPRLALTERPTLAALCMLQGLRVLDISMHCFRWAWVNRACRPVLLLPDVHVHVHVSMCCNLQLPWWPWLLQLCSCAARLVGGGSVWGAMWCVAYWAMATLMGLSISWAGVLGHVYHIAAPARHCLPKPCSGYLIHQTLVAAVNVFPASRYR